jgi:hypothetical protein
MVKVFEVIGSGVIEKLVHRKDLKSLVSVVADAWSVASACTWHDGYVPKPLSDESWRMDAIVKRMKGETHREGLLGEFNAIFTWDSSERKKTTEQLGIPRRWTPVAAQVSTIDEDFQIASVVTWDSPICSNEYAWMIAVARNAIEYITGEDLRKNPKKFSLVRRLVDVSVLLLIAFVSWLYVSIYSCPLMASSKSVLIVQAFFIVLVGLLALKFIGSQYVV